jgi:hypothetical protein
MELKLSMLDVFIDHFLSVHTDRLVEALNTLASRADEPEGMLIVNLNPFMVIMMIYKTIKSLKTNFPSSL